VSLTYVTSTSNLSPWFILVSLMVIQICIYSDMYLFRYVSIQICIYSDMYLFRYVSIQICILCSHCYSHRFICVFHVCGLDEQPRTVIHISFFNGHSDMPRVYGWLLDKCPHEPLVGHIGSWGHLSSLVYMGGYLISALTNQCVPQVSCYSNTCFRYLSVTVFTSLFNIRVYNKCPHEPIRHTSLFYSHKYLVHHLGYSQLRLFYIHIFSIFTYVFCTVCRVSCAFLL